MSIILNVRNGAAYLRAAIDSARAQTVDDWEMIVWDDRSTDGSAEIVASYQDARIRYFLSPDDTPLGPARESAMQQARGEWLGFLDQDDLWMPDKLQRQLALVDGPYTERIGILYGRAVRFDERGRERDFDHRHEYLPLPEGCLFEDLFRDSCFICMSAAMLRRDAVRGLGGIPAEYYVSPDYFLYIEVARHYEARAVQSVVCRYRLHGGNMSHYSWRRENEEALLLIERARPNLPPALADWRVRVHSTVLAVDALLRGKPFTAARILVTRGSVRFLLIRPAAFFCRAVRRRVQTPWWKRL